MPSYISPSLKNFTIGSPAGADFLLVISANAGTTGKAAGNNVSPDVFKKVLLFNDFMAELLCSANYEVLRVLIFNDLENRRRT